MTAMEAPDRNTKNQKREGASPRHGIVQAYDELGPVRIPDIYLAIRPHTKVDSTGKRTICSLTLSKFGGFKWEYSDKLRRYGWRRRPPVYELNNDIETLQFYKGQGAIQCLKELNETEYLDLVLWRQALQKQLNIHRDVPRIASRIERQLVKANLMLQLFVDWYLENGLEVPNVDLGDHDSPQMKIDEPRVAPQKYTEKHFKEFEKLLKYKKQMPAAEDFCKDKGFSSPGGFLRQFRERYLNKKRKMKV